MFRKMDDKGQALICLGLMLAGLVGGSIALFFLIPLLEQLLVYLLVAAVVMVVLAILVKRFLLGGKK